MSKVDLTELVGGPHDGRLVEMKPDSDFYALAVDRSNLAAVYVREGRGPTGKGPRTARFLREEPIKPDFVDEK